jgi:hypothetical protein
MSVGGNVANLTHGGVDMASFRANTAAGAGFQIETHGLIQFALKQFQKFIMGFGIHGLTLS